MISAASSVPDMELFLEDYLERGSDDRPSRQVLQDPFELDVRVDGKKVFASVTALVWRRPSSGALDYLDRLGAQPSKAHFFMREMIAATVAFEGAPDVKPSEAILAKHLGPMDFYRAWEALQDFLPKPKPRAEKSSDASED